MGALSTIKILNVKCQLGNEGCRMLALRVVRANEEWDKYRDNLAEAA